MCFQGLTSDKLLFLMHRSLQSTTTDDSSIKNLTRKTNESLMKWLLQYDHMDDELFCFCHFVSFQKSLIFTMKLLAL